MNEIRCPMCGKPNPEDHDECRYCGARLKPLVGSSRPEERAYQPPTDPIGPEESADEPVEPPPPASPEPQAPQDDWLSALREDGQDDDSSFGDTGELHMDDDEEDDADSEAWFSRIGGDAAPDAPSETPAPSAEPPIPMRDPEPPAEEGLPDWLQTRPAQDEPADAPDWDTGLGDVPSDAQETRDIPGLSFREEFEAAGQEGEKSKGDVPDWLQQIRSEAPSEPQAPPEKPPEPAPDPTAGQEEPPEWLTQPSAPSAPSEGLETKDLSGPTFPSEPEADEPPAAEPAEVPDWLQGLAPEGAQPPAPPTEPPAADEPPAAEPADVPDWLQHLEPERAGTPDPAGEPPPGGTDTQEIPTLSFEEESGGIPEWLKAGDTETGDRPPAAETPPVEPAAPVESDLPDWMAEEGLPPEGLETRDIPGLSFREEPGPAGEAPEDADQVPEWLQNLEPPGEAPIEPASPEPPAAEAADEPGPGDEPETAAEPAELPDWLKAEIPPEGVETLDIPELSFGDDALDDAAAAAAPDWMQDLDTPASEESAALEEAAAAAGFRRPGEPEEIEEAPAGEPMQPELEPEEEPGTQAFQTKDLPSLTLDDEGVVERADTPEWLQEVKYPKAGAQPEEGEEPEWMQAGESDREGPVSMGQEELPDWLRGLQAVQEEAISEVEDELRQDIDTPVAETPEEELPGWLADLRARTGTTAGEEAAPEPDPDSEPEIEAPSEEGAIAPGQLPNWVSEMKPPGTAGEDVPEGLDLEPAELPGWLKAMRPVDAVSPAETTGEGSGEGIEGVGPLAGLSGILPAEPEIAQTGTPATFSMRVEVSKTQYDHVKLLKELIKDEFTAEVSSRRLPIIQTQHILRWIVAVVLILAVGIPALTGTQSTPAPDLVPPETLAVGNIVGSLASGRTVLISFDYQPGLSAEVEAAGAALMDHMMLLGTPMALVSTSTTGPALAERFLSDTPEIQTHGYAHGEQYINLGYIPGGAAGLLDFALSPRRIFPIPFKLAGLSEGTNVWATQPLQGVQQLSDFELVVVLTDDLNSARAWIEQVGPRLGETPLVFVTSAQASPLVMPYYESLPQQVDGLISGVPGGMAYEKLTGRNGQARRYWDAFNNGLMLVNLLILVGGAASVGLFLIRMRAPGSPEEGT